eukprot:TRINITY_DN17515_c0_g1_i1.p1 TRINITY_DN17515_c0_g1~~TRINITY_DN17515_c0_g1_i1.p1  ORF type:complete len:928 (+),score=237.71 TRINITY_DN17515_c0_g1_i1:65-2848(+)
MPPSSHRALRESTDSDDVDLDVDDVDTIAEKALQKSRAARIPADVKENMLNSFRISLYIALLSAMAIYWPIGSLGYPSGKTADDYVAADGRSYLADMKWGPQGWIAFGILFQFGQTLGATINTILHGFIGTCIASAFTILMFGVFPGGYHYCSSEHDDLSNSMLTYTCSFVDKNFNMTCAGGQQWNPAGSIYDGTCPDGTDWEPSSHVGAIGLIMFGAYIVTMLSVKINPSVRFFALLNIVGDAMAFLNPYLPLHGNGYSDGFAIAWTGAAEHRVLSYMAAGCLTLILFLPIPVIGYKPALVQAHDTVKAVLDDAYVLQNQVTDYFCGSQASMLISELSYEFSLLKGRVNSASALMESAWYESFGLDSRWDFTNKTIHVLDLLVASASSLFHMARKEDFGSSHAKMVAVIGEPLKDVLAKSQELVERLQQGIEDGHFEDSEAQEIQQHKEDLEAQFGKMLYAARQASAGLTKKIVDWETLSEFAYIFTIKDCAEQLIHQCDELVKEDRESSSFLDFQAMGSVVDFSHWKWTARTMLQMTICFGLGFYGTCPGETGRDPSTPCFVNEFDAGIISNVVILMNYGAPSTIQSAKSRIVMVVIASVYGQFSYSLLNWCNDAYRLFTVISIFGVCMVCIYMVFSGVEGSGIASRVAAIATAQLLRPCSDVISTYATYSGYYHEFSNLFIAVVVMTAVDIIFSDESPHQMAKKLLFEPETGAMPMFKTLLDDVFSDDHLGEDEIVNRAKAVEDQFTAAKGYADRAPAEQKITESNFPAAAFDSIFKGYMKMCGILKALGHVIDKQGDRKELFDSIATKETVRNYMDELLDQLMHVSVLVMTEADAKDSATLRRYLDTAGRKVYGQKAVGQGELKAMLVEFQDELNSHSVANLADQDLNTMALTLRRSVLLEHSYRIMRMITDTEEQVLQGREK